MVLTVLTLVTAVITISPSCLADNSGLKPFLEKPYKLRSYDTNFDKVLEALGVAWLWRHGYVTDKAPLLTLKWNPDTDVYTLTERSVPYETVETFKIGNGWFEKKSFGGTVEALFTLDGTTLTETQRAKGKPTFVIVRTYSDDEVDVKYEISGIVSYKVYQVVFQ